MHGLIFHKHIVLSVKLRKSERMNVSHKIPTERMQVYSDSDKKYFYMHDLTDKFVCAHCMHACRIHNKMESTFGHSNITYEKARAVHELDSFSTLPNISQKSVRAWCMNPSESDQCDRCTENDQIV